MTERLTRESVSVFERGVVSYSIWQRLDRPIYHPIAKHFKRQLRQAGPSPSVVSVALLAGIFLFFAFSWVYRSVGSRIVWTIPLWLMSYSLLCCIFWMHRIAALVARQGRDGVLEEVSVIPPGRVFIYIAICKVILHENDALAWLTFMRRVTAGMIFLSMFLPLLLTLNQIEHVDFGKLLLLITELSLFSAVIYYEFVQSVALACLLPMALSRRLRGSVDATSWVVICYIVLQILSYAFAVALPLMIQLFAMRSDMDLDSSAFGLALSLAMFLIVRELMLSLLWRAVLAQTNDEHSALRYMAHMGNVAGADALRNKAY